MNESHSHDNSSIANTSDDDPKCEISYPEKREQTFRKLHIVGEY